MSSQKQPVVVRVANADQEREKGEAQASTKLRDKGIEKFDDWMEDFYGVAAIALSDKPQWLEKLGIKEASDSIFAVTDGFTFIRIEQPGGECNVSAGC